MTKITIRNPIYITFDMVTIEEMMPSMQMDVKVVASYSSDQFIYSNRNLWFECQDWDIFINQINNPQQHEHICLHDIDKEFMLYIDRKEGDYLLKIICEKWWAGEGETKLQCSLNIKRDDIKQIAEKFDELVKWW